MEDKDLTRILEDMVARILAEQNATKKLRKLYVAFDDIWHHENYSLASQLISYKERPVYALVAKPCDSEWSVELRKYILSLCYILMMQSRILQRMIVWYYRISHEMMSFILHWGIVNHICQKLLKGFGRQGASVYVLPTSIEPLSGKEPIPYQEMVRSYYKRIFELGIHT